MRYSSWQEPLSRPATCLGIGRREGRQRGHDEPSRMPLRAHRESRGPPESDRADSKAVLRSGPLPPKATHRLAANPPTEVASNGTFRLYPNADHPRAESSKSTRRPLPRAFVPRACLAMARKFNRRSYLPLGPDSLRRGARARFGESPTPSWFRSLPERHSPRPRNPSHPPAETSKYTRRPIWRAFVPHVLLGLAAETNRRSYLLRVCGVAPRAGRGRSSVQHGL